MNIQAIDKKLEQLRKDYVAQPEKRAIIEVQGKLLLKAKEKLKGISLKRSVT